MPSYSSFYDLLEPKIPFGTAGQYWRGDKTWKTLDKAAVGLSNVENTALSTWAGSTNVTTLGTVATGTWTGSEIDSDFVSRIIQLPAIANRNYSVVVKVTSTINSALASISDATIAKRYLVYVPNGTYAEEIVVKDFVDIVGQSTAGTIITSTSQSSHTLDLNGCDTMLANLTITHVTNTGETKKYPVHGDSRGAVTDGQIFLIVNCNVSSTGTLGYGAAGFGLYSNQTLYIINSTFTGADGQGIYVHNTASQSSPCRLFLLNTECRGAGENRQGFLWENIGSGQSDQVFISRGYYDGPRTGIEFKNNGGSGEVFYNIDTYVVSTGYLLTVGTRFYGHINPPSLDWSIINQRLSTASWPTFTGTDIVRPVSSKIRFDLSTSGLGSTSFEIEKDAGAVYLWNRSNTPILFGQNANQVLSVSSSGLLTVAPSGGTAKPWKLGNRSSVSPTSPNRTIEVEVDGVTLYIHAKTTND